MKAVVLAAGQSKRMAPIGDKNFLNFCGKSLIRHQLEMLVEAGFNDIVIVGGEHNLERLEKEAKKVLNDFVVVEQEKLEDGMCGAVLSVQDLISEGEPFLIFSSNDVVDSEAFKLILEASKNGDATSYLIGKKVEKYFPGGYMEIDENGFLKSIIEKPEPGTEPSDLINLVIHLHTNAGVLFEYLKRAESEKDDLYEQALLAMINNGMKLKSVEYSGFWQAVKFPWHIKNVFNFLFARMEPSIAKSASISEKATIKGDVIIGENVTVLENVVISGPVYIGDNSVIANNSLVRDSHIGANCVIGFSTEVARSYLADSVWSHSNYFGDSVIANNVSFGAGAVTGNLRLDEENIMVDVDGKKVDSQSMKLGAIVGEGVRVGINTSLMPGVKIGKNSFIGAGIIISQNIADNMFVRAEIGLKISENTKQSNTDNRKKI